MREPCSLSFVLSLSLSLSFFLLCLSSHTHTHTHTHTGEVVVTQSLFEKIKQPPTQITAAFTPHKGGKRYGLNWKAHLKVDSSYDDDDDDIKSYLSSEASRDEMLNTLEESSEEKIASGRMSIAQRMSNIISGQRMSQIISKNSNRRTSKTGIRRASNKFMHRLSSHVMNLAKLRRRGSALGDRPSLLFGKSNKEGKKGRVTQVVASVIVNNTATLSMLEDSTICKEEIEEQYAGYLNFNTAHGAAEAIMISGHEDTYRLARRRARLLGALKREFQSPSSSPGESIRHEVRALVHSIIREAMDSDMVPLMGSMAFATTVFIQLDELIPYLDKGEFQPVQNAFLTILDGLSIEGGKFECDICFLCSRFFTYTIIFITHTHTLTYI